MNLILPYKLIGQEITSAETLGPLASLVQHIIEATKNYL